MSAGWRCVLGAALALVACAPSPGPRATPPAGGQAASGVGPGISIDQALSPDLDGPLLVNGWLWRRGDGVLRLCSALTGGSPPRCEEPSLEVAGFDLGRGLELRRDGDVTWSEQPVQVLGELNGRTLTVAALSSG